MVSLQCVATMRIIIITHLGSLDAHESQLSSQKLYEIPRLLCQCRYSNTPFFEKAKQWLICTECKKQKTWFRTQTCIIMKWACEEETHGPSIGIFSFTYLDEKCQGAPLKNRHDSFPSPSQHDRVELFYDIGVFSVALRPSLSQIFLPAILQENC